MRVHLFPQNPYEIVFSESKFSHKFIFITEHENFLQNNPSNTPVSNTSKCRKKYSDSQVWDESEQKSP